MFLTNADQLKHNRMPTEQKTSIAWTHAGVLFGLTLLFMSLFPVPQLLYLGSVATYYSSKRGVAAWQKGHRRYPILLSTSVILGIATTTVFGSQSFELREMFGAAGVILAVFALIATAFWLAILWMLSALIAVPFLLAQRRRHRWEKAELERQYCDAERRRSKHERLQGEARSRESANQQRRVEARAQCELAYSLHASEIEDRFPKATLSSFMQTYMSDAQPVEAVERRGNELRRIIQQHRETVQPRKKCHTVQGLAEWFLAEKERIEALPVDEELREEHLVQLNMRYAELTHNMLQKMEP